MSQKNIHVILEFKKSGKNWYVTNTFKIKQISNGFFGGLGQISLKKCKKLPTVQSEKKIRFTGHVSE